MTKFLIKFILICSAFLFGKIICADSDTIQELNSTINELMVKITSLENTTHELTNKLQNITKELNASNEKLEITSKQLENTKQLLNKCNALENADNIYGLKNYTNFTENNIQKALFYPNILEVKVSQSEAKSICNQHSGATLVEIETYQKQTIVQSFIHKLSSATKAYYIGGIVNTSGKYVWLNSGNEFKYANWAPGNPNPKLFQYVCIGSKIGDTAVDGGWISCGSGYDVICEIKY